MLYREIIAVCSEIHIEHINTLCGQNVELVDVKLVVHIETTALQRAKMTEKASKPVSTCMLTDIYYFTAKPYYLTLCSTEFS